jgi:hypothetical protein
MTAALAACGLSAGTGFLLLRFVRDNPAAGGGAMTTAHSVAGYVTGGLACVVASISFLLGIQGLLEAGGKRVPSGLLFLLAPTVMGLALATALTGHAGWEDALTSELQGAQLRALAARHGGLLTSLLAASLAASAATAWWLLRTGHTDDD